MTTRPPIRLKPRCAACKKPIEDAENAHMVLLAFYHPEHCPACAAGQTNDSENHRTQRPTR